MMEHHKPVKAGRNELTWPRVGSRCSNTLLLRGWGRPQSEVGTVSTAGALSALAHLRVIKVRQGIVSRSFLSASIYGNES